MKTIDVHAHCLIPAASNLLGEDAYKHHTGGIVMEDAATRLRDMDAQGIDMEALGVSGLNGLMLSASMSMPCASMSGSRVAASFVAIMPPVWCL